MAASSGQPSPRLVLEHIRKNAAQAPEAIAVVCGADSLSYAALLGRALQLADRLRALDLAPDSRVAIYAPRSVETVTGILGVLAAGAAYVPLDPDYPAELLNFMLQDSGAVATIVPDPRKAASLSTAGPVLAVAADSTPAATGPPTPAPDHLAYVIYTSGSTGKPKGVMVTQRNLAHSTHARFDCYEKAPARFLLLSSFAFDSSVAGLFWTLCAGGTLVLPAEGEERDPVALAALIATQRITHTLCLPSLHALLLDTGGVLDSLQTVIVAGESCPPELPARHARRLPGARLFNEYGPTEACVWSTVARLHAAAPVTIGQAIAGTRVHLLDEAGDTVAAGQAGEIHIGGEGVARGYLNLPELTAEKFLPDPWGAPGALLYKTGDRARMLPGGDLEFLGRLDHQVKIRGFRIEPDAIEAVLRTHPAVRAAVVLARTEEDGEARLVAYVTPAGAPVAALRQLVAEKLPAFMMPSAFVALADFPLKPNGKVDRAALPAPGRGRPELASAYAAPRTTLEHFLAAEWRAVLRLERVGIHDKLFELGGDSLRAATLANRLQQKLGEPVFVVALFEAPTIAALAAYLEKHYAAPAARCFGEASVPPTGGAGAVSPAKLAAVRDLLPKQRTPGSGAGRPKNRRAIFILAPPRSGTTLLRAMLAGHPGLFTTSELRLLGFETLAERHRAQPLWRRSLIEAVLAARGGDEKSAEETVAEAEHRNLSTAEFFAQLQQWIAPRELVDKSPSYALDAGALQQAEAIFEDAFYIHLSRHPYEMVRSFAERRMDRVYLPQCADLTPREAGELVWLISHQNIAAFLSAIPPARQHTIRFADLVHDPRATMSALCNALGLPFDPALLDPYKHVATPKPAGLHTADDPRFHEHAGINPAVAEGWRAAATDNFLSDLSWQLAETLGYEKPATRRTPPAASPRPAHDDAIAIIGMAGHFPGARDVESFWKNLCDGVESIRPFTADELRASGVDPATVAEPGYVNAGAVPDDADRFAASFFGCTPREAELMDPQQRVFLECAWEAFEHAGQDVARFPGAIGVYAGLALNSYFQNNLATRPELAPLLGQYPLTIGNEKDFVATRVAHKLDLRGPAIGVQTACSSSLVALHLACQSLRAGEIAMALVGGGRIRAPLHAGYQYIDGGIPSPDGHCRAFDAQARGCVAASGIAAVVLKRLADAQRDGDRIYGVVKATAINNDGAAKTGFTAPGIEGQAEVIARTHATAGVTSDTIGYVEAHGTGTSIGDPIEITALTRAFRATSDRTGHCRIGSVKSNIGHLDAGAGVAGLIKTTLALDRGLLPPSLHFETPNPQIDFARSPFVVNTALTPWPRGAAPRRAGVSSFGIGGTNAHALLEEAPRSESSSASRPWQVLVLSAKTASALDRASANLAQHLRGHPDVSLADVAHTLQVGRREFAHRRMLVARDPLEAAEALEKMDTRHVFTALAKDRAPAVVFLFPGQGAQHPGMLRELFESEPVFRDALTRCAELLRPQLDLLAALYPEQPSAEAMTQTAIAQPAIFAVEYALAKLWESWGVQPSALVGHSVGEFVAACLAGVFTLEDALALLGARARLLQDLPRGSMLAVRLAEAELLPHLGDGIELAAVNSPRLCVVSGPAEAVAAFAEKMAAQDIACAPLQTSHAFHSAMVEPAVAPLAALARQTRLHAPHIPIHSTLTGGAADFTAPEYWARQLREPVRFAEAVAAIDPDHTLLEVGPGTTLAPLARQSRGGTVIASQHAGGDRQQHALLEALGRLWLDGVPIDWSRHRAGERRLRVALPTYPFERERYWIEPATPLRTAAVESTGTRLSASPAAPAPAPQRNDTVAEIQAVLHELSGVPVERMRSSATLLEIGFDSLFLTQAILALQKRFGVKIAFRQLFEELPTIDALAGFIDSRTPQRAPKPAATPATSPTASAPDVAQKSFGPFRPIDRSAAPALSPRQRQHLDTLTARYTARTAASKRLAEEHRPHFADPRSVSGFRPFWKELVYPIVVERSSGAKLWDVDGREYIDFTMGFGTNLFGHSPPFVTEAIAAQLGRGIEIGPQSPLAGEVARLLCEFSGMERAAFCNTGSEAVLAAVRVARTVTGRERIATCSGYHGINDEFLVRAKTIDGQRRSVAIAPGIPDHVAREVLAVDYGTPESLEILRAHAHELAAVLVEPVQSRNPSLQPREFLEELRAITSEAGVALVFDEVITGFRCHPGGAQAWFGIRADLVTYGKVIGGGMPIGALCGKAEYLDALDGGAWRYGDDSRPETGVTFFAGTYVRHPLALAASRAVLTHLKAEGAGIAQRLNERTAQLVAELNGFLSTNSAAIRIESFGSMFILKFAADFAYGALLFFHLREKGIHAWDNRLLFLSTAHTEEDLAAFVRAFRESVLEMQAGGFLPGGALAPAAFTGAEFPLTDAQQELLLATQMESAAAAAFNESSTIHLRGKLDAAALHAALNRLVARHEALRTTFSEDGQTQRVAPALAVELPLVDFSTLAGDAQTRAVSERIESETTRPFNLAQGPLLRAVLVKLAEDRHDLVLTMHHIVCDGWSFANVAADLAALYSGRPLAAPCAFREYARWLDEKQSAPEFAATEAFWLRQFAELPPAMELPADHPRGKERSYRGARGATLVPQDLHEGLKRFSAVQRCTLFTTMLAAFHVLLHRLTGQDDLVVGIAAAGQAAMGRADLTGHCVNFLPIRARMTENPDFTSFLGAMRVMLLDAFDHQNQTFGALLRKLALPRDASRMPLLGATFNLDRNSADLDFAGLDAEFESNPKLRLGFELSFNLIETERGIQIDCAFNRDLFEPATIDRWLGHYLTLLAGIVAEPSAALSRLPILCAAGRQRILTEWSGTARPYPQDQTVAARFAECAAKTPEALAVLDGDERLTYAELDRRANRVGNFLQARGVRTGDFVGLRAERSLAFVVKVLGIAKAGAAYLPLDESEPAERLAAMKAACAFILEAEPEGDLPGGTAASGAQAAGPAYVLFTSGSTGVPKGVIIPHRGITRLVVNNDYAPFQPDDVVAFASNVCFDAATFEIWGALLNGGSLVITPHDVLLSPSALQAHLAKHRVSVLFLTTSLFNQLAHEAPAMFGGLRMLVFGGEAADAASVRLVLENGKPQRFVNGYGPTETTTFAICHVIEKLAGEAVPIGRPIANTQVFLFDREREPVPVGVRGEIFIGGPGVALGYLNEPALTAERFLATPLGRLYKTGDLARYRDDGTIEYCGRIDSQLKLRGFRIEPGEIEAALLRHPGVRQAAVTVRHHGDDRLLVAHLVPADASSAPDDLEMRGFLQQHLPAPMVPAAFSWLPALPLTANGKVDRKALEKAEGVALSTGTDHAPASNELQSRLVEIWQTVLNREGVGIRDNFFALGGHSLLAARLIAEVDKQLGHKLPIAALFQSPTVESLAERLEEEDWTPPWNSLVPLQPHGSKPPIFFVHGVQGDVYGFLDLAKLLPADQPSYGIQAIGLDGKTERHVTVEDMAAFYVKEIVAFQPEGPLHLAGFSMGGVIAYEIAQQLHRRGRRVALLALLDSGPTGPTPWRYFALARCAYLSKRSLFHLRQLWQGSPNQGWFEYLRKRFASLLHYVDGNRSKAPVVTAPPQKGTELPEVPGFIDYYHAVASAYQLRPYPGSLDLFVSAYVEDNWRWYWKWLVRGGVSFHAFPGEHMDLLFNPHGRAVLAEFLTAHLERARQKEPANTRQRRQPEPSLVS